MEERVFSLLGTSDLLLGVANRLFYLVVLAVITVSSWKDSGMIARLGMLALLLLVFVLIVWFVLAERSRRLNVSEDGFTVTWWPRGQTCVPWEAVLSCQLWPASRSSDQPFQRVNLQYSRWRALTIWGSCPDAAEILDILKQRLPEQVFETR